MMRQMEYREEWLVGGSPRCTQRHTNAASLYCGGLITVSGDEVRGQLAAMNGARPMYRIAQALGEKADDPLRFRVSR